MRLQPVLATIPISREQKPDLFAHATTISNIHKHKIIIFENTMHFYNVFILHTQNSQNTSILNTQATWFHRWNCCVHPTNESGNCSSKRFLSENSRTLGKRFSLKIILSLLLNECIAFFFVCNSFYDGAIIKFRSWSLIL